MEDGGHSDMEDDEHPNAIVCVKLADGDEAW
jgi:hypothetical protein